MKNSGPRLRTSRARAITRGHAPFLMMMSRLPEKLQTLRVSRPRLCEEIRGAWPALGVMGHTESGKRGSVMAMRQGACTKTYPVCGVVSLSVSHPALSTSGRVRRGRCRPHDGVRLLLALALQRDADTPRVSHALPRKRAVREGVVRVRVALCVLGISRRTAFECTCCCCCCGRLR